MTTPKTYEKANKGKPIKQETYVDKVNCYIYMLLEIPVLPPPPPSNTPPSPHWWYDLQDIRDKLVHSFQNRPIDPLKGFIVSTHRLSCPTRPPPPTPRSLLFKESQAPTPLKTSPSPHRLHDLQDTLDKLMRFLPQLSDFVPLKSGFYIFRAQTD